MLRDGTPTIVEPLKDYPLKNKFWRVVTTTRLFRVLQVDELTLIIREYYEPHLYNDPRTAQELAAINRQEDFGCNRWVFESEIETGNLIEVIPMGLLDASESTIKV